MMHHPTPDESTWAWWCLMWAIENVSFKKNIGMSSSRVTADPEQHLVKKDNGYLGSALHQNSCGHGFSWKDRRHEISEPSIYPVSPHHTAGHGKGGWHGSQLGQSPSEYQHRRISRR